MAAEDDGCEDAGTQGSNANGVGDLDPKSLTALEIDPISFSGPDGPDSGCRIHQVPGMTVWDLSRGLDTESCLNLIPHHPENHSVGSSSFGSYSTPSRESFNRIITR